MHVATITIDHLKVAGDLTDYVVAVLNNSDAGWAELYSTATSGGGDIRVYKSGGVTELPREIVSFSVVGETGEIHIKYTGTLSGSVDTDIEIHADGTSSDYAVTATYGRNAVWSDYEWVSHLFDLTTSTVEDATGGGLTGSKSSAGNPAEVTAQIGNGQDVDGTDLIDTASVPMTVTDNFTLQGWFNPDAATTNTAIVQNGADPDGYAIAMRDDGGKVGWTMLLAARTWGEAATLPSVTAGSWQMVHTTRDSGTTYIFKDGTKSTGVTIAPNTPTTRLRLGVATFANAYAGLMDEVRIKTGVLSDTWITTEYNNQNDNAAFWVATDVSGGGGGGGGSGWVGYPMIHMLQFNCVM